MNFGTLRARILRSLYQDMTDTSQKVLDDVNLAIVESIRHLAYERFPFNQKDFTQVLDGETFEYPMPDDYLALTEKVYYTEDGGFTRVIDVLPIQQVMESYGEVDSITLNAYVPVQTSVPFIGVDSVKNKFFLSPALNLRTGRISFRYLADVGILEALYSSGAWSFTRRGVAVNTDTHTSPWFREGYTLLYHRAMHLLWSELYGGTEESMAKSKMEYDRMVEQMRRINSELTKGGMTTRPRGYI